MYKGYNMTQHMLTMETSVLIPTNDMPRHVNEIVETILHNEFKHHRGATSYHPIFLLYFIKHFRHYALDQ